MKYIDIYSLFIGMLIHGDIFSNHRKKTFEKRKNKMRNKYLFVYFFLILLFRLCNKRQEITANLDISCF